MDERAIIEILVEVRDSQLSALGIYVTINFAMIASAYYFLSRAMALLKFMALLAYSLGVSICLGVIHLHSEIYSALRNDLERIGADSLAARQFLTQRSDIVTLGVDVALVSISAALWLSAFYLLFFWRRPARG